MPFACSICEQQSTRICAFCTKDACDNHVCQRCGYCSDCCQCDVPLEEPLHVSPEAALEHEAAPVAEYVPPGETQPGIEPQPPAVAWAPAEAQSAEAQSATPEESEAAPLETPEV